MIRRNFIQSGILGLASGASAAGRRPASKSTVSFVASKNTREAAYLSLKPLADEVAKAIGRKQVAIKVNTGVPLKEHQHESTDVDQLRGILDFLKPIYNRPVIIAEGAATLACSVLPGYEAYGYRALEREYKIKLIDANDLTTVRHWILAGYHIPQPINVIDLYLDPNVYLISACRLKPSGGVIVSLSVKNTVMGSPICHYRQNKGGRAASDINEKSKMHGGPGSVQGRELSYNIFTIANAGVYPDLAVLDGVVAAEGNGPWNATPIQHGVALAGTDCVAVDRIGAELMGVDYSDLMYLQWCAQAGIGQDEMSKISYIGEDFRKYIVKYKLNKNLDSQRQWIYDLRKVLAAKVSESKCYSASPRA
jgi:uncharacterized protein (DUF362 family)